MLRLERAWRAEEPKRAGGGENALAGFEYQFAVAIRDMVRRFHAQPGAAEADPSILVEALEDIAWVDDRGSIVITQVKRSATRERFRATLDNFVLIDRLARRVEPPVGEVRFEIVVGRGGLATAREWVRDWAKENRYDRKDVAQRVRVEQRPDPRYEALALIANDLLAPHPEETFDRVLAALFRGASDGSGFVAAAQAAWSVLLEAKRTPAANASAYIWMEADRQPDTLRRGRVLTGQHPTVADLRDGAFAPRPALTEALYRVARHWFDADEHASGIPVLFIAGRSGCGKSVILLQLLERIHRELGCPIFLTSSREGNLGATAAWIRHLAGEEHCVIGLDAVGPVPDMSGWRQLVGALYADRQRGRVLPVVVTTGSLEQAHRLAEHFPDDLDVSTVAMPLERESEVASLAHWFARRTGREPVDARGHGGPLVWLFFEWSFGDLREFSLRLRHSVDALDQSGAVRQVVTDLLVTNEMELPFPHAALDALLTPEQHRGLAGLLRDASLGLEDKWLGGTWLAHPTVGREIYRHWAGSAERRERTTHVEHAVTTVIRHGDADATTHVVRALYRRWRTAQIADGPLASVDWLSVLATIYPLAVSLHGGDVPLDELHAWIRVRGQRRLDAPDPVARAMQWLVPQNADRDGMTTAIEAMLEESEVLPATLRQELTDSVLRLLDKRRDIRDWPRIAGSALRTTDAPALRRQLGEWLAESHTGRAEGWLLAETHKRFPDDPVIREITDRVLLRPTFPSWPLVWSSRWAVDCSEILAEHAVRWLARTGYEDRSWAWVWTTLWDAEPSLVPMRTELAALARGFLATGPSTHGGWVRVFNGLWSTDRCDELNPSAYQWLDDAEHHTHGGYPWLWETLWKDENERDKIRSYALAWLAASPDLPRWGVVYRKVLEDDPSAELLELGCVWLDLGPPAHYDWGWVFPAVWEATADAETRNHLYRRGLRWLIEAPDAHLGWPYVFSVLSSHEDTQRLREQAERWLESVKSSHAGWGRVWEDLGGSKDDASCGRAIRFLRDALPDRADHQAWARVWHATWNREKSSELFQLGRAWLHLVDNLNPGRSYVQLALLHRALHPDALGTAEAEDVINDAMAWIREVDQWGDGGYIVWEHLFLSGLPELKPELFRLGTASLELLRKDERGWTDVWTRLWGYAASDDLAGHAREWLRVARADTPGWQAMLRYSLPIDQMLDADLRATALHLLGRAGSESPDVRRLTSLWQNLAAAYAAVTGDHYAASDHRLFMLTLALSRGVLDDTLDAANLRKGLADEAAMALLSHAPDPTMRSLWLRLCSETPVNRIDDVLKAELERQRTRPEITPASAMIVAAGRAGRLGVAVDVLLWVADLIEVHCDDRSVEVLVKASQTVVSRVATEAPDDDAATEAVERFRRAGADWNAAFPEVPPLRKAEGEWQSGQQRPGALDAIRTRWRTLFSR